MKILNIRGKLVNININKYKVNWDRIVSKPQKLVKDFLYPYWKNHIVLEEARLPGSLLRLDLCSLNSKIIVETSPEGSHDFNQFFHKNRIGFLNSLKRDMKKAEWAERAGFKFVEFNNEDLKQLSHAYVLKKFDIYL